MTLNGIGCAFADSVNAESSMGCAGSAWIWKAHWMRAVFRNTELIIDVKKNQWLKYRKGTHAVAICWPGHTRRPNPKVYALRSSLIFPSGVNQRWGLKLSGSGNSCGSRPTDLYVTNENIILQTVALNTTRDQESDLPDIAYDTCTFRYTIILLEKWRISISTNTRVQETLWLTQMISLVALCAKPAVDEIHQGSMIEDNIEVLTTGGNRPPPERF